MKAYSKSVLSLGAAAFWIFAIPSAAQQAAPAQSTASGAKKAPAPTQTKKPAAKPAPLETPQLKFEKYKLENGLDVILSEDHRLPLRSEERRVGKEWRSRWPAYN